MTSHDLAVSNDSAMEARDGKLLVRASANSLCVFRDTTLRNPARMHYEFTHIVLTKINIRWENFRRTGFLLIATHARCSSYRRVAGVGENPKSVNVSRK